MALTEYEQDVQRNLEANEMISRERLNTAISATEHVDSVMNDPRLTWEQRANMLACELQRVNALLVGDAYYDYTNKKWKEDDCARRCGL